MKVLRLLTISTLVFMARMLKARKRVLLKDVLKDVWKVEQKVVQKVNYPKV